MNRQSPTVSIGIPVYNGGHFLSGSIESLLDQTFEDFELIIADNASTDTTEEICRAYARRDKRIRYVRNAQNIGVLPNFNKVFRIARGTYFKWAAADDVCQPTFLERCVAALDEHPSAALSYAQCRVIDEEGRFLPYDEDRKAYIGADGRAWYYDPQSEVAMTSDDPTARYRAILWSSSVGTVVYGLFRSDVLRATSLYRRFGSDGLLLAEAGLQGRFVKVQEPLFYRRLHSQSTWHLSRREVAEFQLGHRIEKVFLPPWRSFLNYSRGILASDLSLMQRLRCLSVTVQYALRPASLKNIVVPGPDNYWGFNIKLTSGKRRVLAAEER